jgi:tRNA A37 methylthiotransferase MiaB
VLVEHPGFGHSEHYAPVRFTGTVATGRVVAVRIAAAAAGELIGEVA